MRGALGSLIVRLVFFSHSLGCFGLVRHVSRQSTLLKGAFCFVLCRKKGKKMKNSNSIFTKSVLAKSALTKSLLALILVSASILCLFSCKGEQSDPWESAYYTEDATIGGGATTLQLVVEAGERSITLTVKTDKSTLGEALIEHNLIEGEMGDYGLYVKKVNGMVADYDIDQSYWALYINGEYGMSGVDTTPVTEGTVYKLARTVG